MDFFETKARFDKEYSVISPFLPEIIAVKFGLKISTMITVHNNGDFKKTLRSLEYFSSRENLRCSHHIFNGQCKIFISNRRLGEVVDPDHPNDDGRFSYPECCQKSFSGFPPRYRDIYTVNGFRPVVEGLGGRGRIPFRMNIFLMSSPFHLYLHLPCSLFCESTMDYTKKLLAIIRRENAELYKAIVLFNCAPVFYTDVCGAGILFGGAMKTEKDSSSIFYNSVYYAYEPDARIAKSSCNDSGDADLFKDIAAALRKGDRATFRDNALTITNNSRPIGVFERPPSLLWKAMDFSRRKTGAGA